MSTAICVDCDRTVEVDDHGRCVECGSTSTLHVQYNRASNTTQPLLDVDKIIGALEILTPKLTSTPPTIYTRAAILLASARIERMAGFSLGQFLENAISMWNLAAEMLDQEEKSDPAPKGN